MTTNQDIVDRMLNEFYLSAAYDPNAARHADVTKAAIRFTLEAVLAAIPDDIDMFRIIRAAGRSDADKAKAVTAALPDYPYISGTPL